MLRRLKNVKLNQSLMVLVLILVITLFIPLASAACQSDLVIYQRCNSLMKADQKVYLPSSDYYSQRSNQTEVCVSKRQTTESPKVTSVVGKRYSKLELEQDIKIFEELSKSTSLIGAVDEDNITTREILIMLSEEEKKVIDEMTKEASKSNQIELDVAFNGRIIASLVAIEHIKEGELRIFATELEFNKVWSPIIQNF